MDASHAGPSQAHDIDSALASESAIHSMRTRQQASSIILEDHSCACRRARNGAPTAHCSDAALVTALLPNSCARQEAASVAPRPERHSLLPLPAWGIVPGARFREVYYWDSLWVVRGLLASAMRATAQACCFAGAPVSAHSKQHGTQQCGWGLCSQARTAAMSADAFQECNGWPTASASRQQN